MKSNLRRNPDATVEIEVELENAEMRPYLVLAAEKLSKDKAIEGFRPGKAPLEVVKRALGEMKVYEQAVAFAIDGTVPKIILENRIRVVGKPEISVTKVAPGNPLSFTLKTAIIPDFTLPDIEPIAKKVASGKIVPKVEEKEKEEAIEWLRKSRATSKPVLRPAANGDRVEIDFKGKSEGVVLERGSSTNHPLKIGEGKFVPGFEKNLIGMTKGESKKFSITMPGDYHEKTLAGKQMDFDVTINHIEEEILPELSDEFAKSLGKFENIAELHANIESGLLEEKGLKEKERIRIAIMDAIVSKIEIPIASTLVETELEKMIGELRQNIEGMQLKYEDYLTHIKKTEAELRKDWKEDAKRRVKIALILGKIAEVKEIRPTREEVEAEIRRVFEKYAGPEEARKELDPEAVASFARNVARNEKVFEYLEGLA